MKDSGKRDTYNGGAVRDKREGKGRFDLISPIALFRLARVYEEGAMGKGDRNWEQGIDLSRFIDSALRHLQQYLAGMRDEDHLAQAAWNVFGCIHTEDQILKGSLPDSLNDLPQPYVHSGFADWDQLAYREDVPSHRKRFYVAASVRGPDGDNALPEAIKKNIESGLAYVDMLREAFPQCEFYSPHEHEPLFQEAFQKRIITSRAILEQCFSIVRLCDVLLACSSPEESSGVRVEIDEARRHNIPVVALWKHNQDVWPTIIRDVLESE